jgi:hypothetical protein
MTELLIQVDSSSQCPHLAGFLRGCHAQPRIVDEYSLAIDLAEDVSRARDARRSGRGVAGLVAGGRGLAHARR